MICAACNGGCRKSSVHPSVYECTRCGGLNSDCIYLGESYGIVKPFFTTDPTADERAKYFDFTCLGSNGVVRRHGWFDPTTGLLTQVG